MSKDQPKKGFWANLLSPTPSCVCPTVEVVEETSAKAPEAAPQAGQKVAATASTAASDCSAEQAATCNAASTSPVATSTPERKPAVS